MCIELSHRPSNRDKYSIIIPAAGLGKRLKSVGPKCLVQINNETILARQLRLIHKIFHYYEVIVVGGYQINKLKKYTNNQVKLISNDDYENTNVLHSIHLGLQKIKTNRAIIIYGDLIFNKECISQPFHGDSGVVIAEGMKTEEVGVVYKNNMLESMFYGLVDKWAQISYFTNNELDLLKEIASKYPDWFGFESINYMINKGSNFKIYSPKFGYSVDIDSSHDLKKFNENINKTNINSL